LVQSALIGVGANNGTAGFEIKQGSILIDPRSELSIKTPMGLIRIGCDALVLVSCTADTVALYDLDDAHRGDVSVETRDGTNFRLSPGHHVLISRAHTGNAHGWLPGISHRCIVRDSLRNGLVATSSEFSVVSAAGSLPVLAAMTHSRDRRHNSIVRKLLKTVAASQSLENTQESFHMVVEQPSASTLHG
jgi:hypothetical protein